MFRKAAGLFGVITPRVPVCTRTRRITVCNYATPIWCSPTQKGNLIWQLVDDSTGEVCSSGITNECCGN